MRGEGTTKMIRNNTKGRRERERERSLRDNISDRFSLHINE
jgi:hypothetical protein